MKILNKFKVIGASAIIGSLLAVSNVAHADVEIDLNILLSYATENSSNNETITWSYRTDYEMQYRKITDDINSSYVVVNVNKEGKINNSKQIIFTTEPSTFVNGQMIPVEANLEVQFPNNEMIQLHIDKKGKITQSNVLKEKISAGEYYLHLKNYKNNSIIDKIIPPIKVQLNDDNVLELRNLKLYSSEQLKEFEQQFIAIDNTKKEQKKKDNLIFATTLISTLSLFGIGALVSGLANKDNDIKKSKKLK